MNGGRCVVIGIGNPGRGDDAVGRVVLRQLSGAMPSGVDLVEQDGEATALLACFHRAEAAYLIDACVSGAPPGSVRRLDVAAAPLLQEEFAMSTHALGLAQGIELARALGELPRRCVVYAVEAASFEAGAPLSPPVAAAVRDVAGRLRGEICGIAASEQQANA